MAYIKCVELALGYEGELIAENINFEVNKGDYLCVVGENGSGKSTLMKTLLGLLPCIKGEIIFDDELSEGGIGYLPQQTLVQRDFPASVEEVVLSGCQNRLKGRCFYNREDRAIAEKNMERMQIKELRRRCYRELSGGQQQRVLLARALCATKNLIVLDEPVSGLDPLVTADMYELIHRLNEEGITIIMISHDTAAAVKYASHILHMDRRVFFGSVEEYLNSKIGKLFLAMEGGE